MRMHVTALRAAISMAALLLLFAPRGFSQTLRVEAENLVPPSGNATVGSGPNISGVVSIDSSTTMSGGKYIGFFVYWDWLEYEATIPEDGVYSITLKYASDWGTATGVVPVVFTFLTSGQQIIAQDIPKTANWGDYQVLTVSSQVALKAGPNRFRIWMRPDAAEPDFGGGMNLDYIDLTKTGAFPALTVVTGTVKANVNGTPAPLEGAMVSVGDNSHTSQYVTRTDASGAYSMYVPAGAQNLTAFMNGYQAATATVTAPGTHEFLLTYSGRFEAELLDATNAGRDRNEGFQPEYTTALNSDNQPRSRFGHLVDATINKFAEYRHVVVPSAGVYDLSMYYGSGVVGNLGFGRYHWSANGGPSAEMQYPSTGDYTIYQTSPKVLLTLKAGVNTIRLSNPDDMSSANVDYFTLAPAAANTFGTLKVVVTSPQGTPVIGANMKVNGPNTAFAGLTGSDGTLSLPAFPGAYDVTVTRSGASAFGSGTVTAGSTTNVPVTLAITAITVEGEDFAASGPNVPAGVIAPEPTASGGEVVTGLSGQDRFEWMEWILNAAQDGLYQVSLGYSSVNGFGSHTVNVWSTGYQLSVPEGLPLTAGANDYQVYPYAYTFPLKAGENRLRITMDMGSINVDYLTFERTESLPAQRAMTGTVLGTDGTGSAPIQDARPFVTTSDPNINYVTRTDAEGKYALSVPTTVALLVGINAEGYASPEPKVVFAGGTYTATLAFNNPAGASPPEMQIGSRSVVTIDPALHTSEGEISFGYPGGWFELLVNAPRAGIYRVGMEYSSGWNPEDGLPVRSEWDIDGVKKTINFPKTTSWADYQVVADIGSIPLQAGPNHVRVTYLEAAANVKSITLLRTGDIATTPTDLNNNGKTDLVDAVIYARRLSGLDTGATPDLNGDSQSNAQDVRRILAIAGGLP